MRQTRRLAAILAADVAGYSRLMGADEEGTHERLKKHLRELIEPKIAVRRLAADVAGEAGRSSDEAAPGRHAPVI
jgi:class 3 adenylate cyclase